ncbi:MAG: T9SS type A sorting domain-containing protein [Ignavibacteria bacterium]|nr:T9SS type A sorting domain-containing protein [Ignavibacteria bacterium]
MTVTGRDSTRVFYTAMDGTRVVNELGDPVKQAYVPLNVPPSEAEVTVRVDAKGDYVFLSYQDFDIQYDYETDEWSRIPGRYDSGRELTVPYGKYFLSEYDATSFWTSVNLVYDESRGTFNGETDTVYVTVTGGGKSKTTPVVLTKKLACARVAFNPTNLSVGETATLEFTKEDGSATPAQLSAFTRTPIRTLYLRKAGESQCHMVDEPYDYSGVSAAESPNYETPDAFVIHQNFPNPSNPTTSIQYYLPRAGDVRLEIFNIYGELVDLLEDGFLSAGDHVKVWKSEQRPSGTYFYRMTYEGFSLTKAMLLVK